MKITQLTVGLGIFFAILATSYMVLAVTIEEGKQASSTTQGSDIPLLGDKHEKRLDDAQVEATALLLGAAQWIDSFFDDGRSVSEDNQTRATIKLSLGYSKNDDFEVQPRFDLRLKLPRLSSKALLIISAADDDDFDIESNPVSNRPSDHDDSKYSDLTIGLKRFLLEGEKYNLSIDGGVSWDYLFAGARYRALQDLGNWQGRFTNRLRYYTDDGWENLATYDFETYWDDTWMFRTTSSVVLAEEEAGIPHSQYFKLFQVLSEYQVLSYESGIYLDTEPDYLMTDLQFKLRYRERFYRDWLVFEIVPSITFPEETDYETNPGIMVKLEATFGYDSETDVYKKIFKH